MANITEMLKEFHNAYGCSVGDTDFQFADRVHLREKLIHEEYQEVREAFSLKDKANLLKELCDLVYVCVGTAVAFGMDFDGGFRAVHESNMSKLGLDGRPIRNDIGKVLKGENYLPPDMESFV